MLYGTVLLALPVKMYYHTIAYLSNYSAIGHEKPSNPE